mmetsp:Transcript_19496/g.36980  ORF Transcript_19496/g.36980 Transcript_19496/m.36980 type:complete len:133 (+) Transcript_19496:64-462(+)
MLAIQRNSSRIGNAVKNFCPSTHLIQNHHHPTDRTIPQHYPKKSSPPPNPHSIEPRQLPQPKNAPTTAPSSTSAFPLKRSHCHPFWEGPFPSIVRGYCRLHARFIDCIIAISLYRFVGFAFDVVIVVVAPCE